MLKRLFILRKIYLLYGKFVVCLCVYNTYTDTCIYSEMGILDETAYVIKKS